MEIVHHFAFNADARDRAELARMGIGVTVGPGLVVLDSAESDGSWPAIANWMLLRGITGLVWTTFSSAELQQAAWLELGPTSHHGYPQPEDDFGYLAMTYDLSQFCSSCGVGLEQVRPFRMRRELNLGTRRILQLNWVFDEYFVPPDVWSKVFQPLGVAFRPVENTRGRTLASVVQLVIDERVPLDMNGFEPVLCPVCGRPKYLPITRGPTPPLVTAPSGHLARTTQWFGSGASAHNENIASQALRAAIQMNNLRGVQYRPVRQLRLMDGLRTSEPPIP